MTVAWTPDVGLDEQRAWGFDDELRLKLAAGDGQEVGNEIAGQAEAFGRVIEVGWAPVRPEGAG
jgi:hypothetical protein